MSIGLSAYQNQKNCRKKHYKQIFQICINVKIPYKMLVTRIQIIFFKGKYNQVRFMLQSWFNTQIPIYVL